MLILVAARLFWIISAVSFSQARPSSTKVSCQPAHLIETNLPFAILAASWEYSYFVPHDMAKLVSLMGGAATYITRLDTFFDQGFHDIGLVPFLISISMYSLLKVCLLQRRAWLPSFFPVQLCRTTRQDCRPHAEDLEERLQPDHWRVTW